MKKTLLILASGLAISSATVWAAGTGARAPGVAIAAAHPVLVQTVSRAIAANPAAQAKMNAAMAANPAAAAKMKAIQAAAGNTPPAAPTP